MRSRLFLFNIWRGEVPDLRAARASITGPTTIGADRTESRLGGAALAQFVQSDSVGAVRCAERIIGDHREPFEVRFHSRACAAAACNRARRRAKAVSFARIAASTCTLTTCRRGRVAQHSRTTHSFKPPSRMVQTRLQQRHSSRCRCRHRRGQKVPSTRSQRRDQKVPTTHSQRGRSAMRPLRSRRASRLQLQLLDQRLRRAAHGRGAAA